MCDTQMLRGHELVYCEVGVLFMYVALEYVELTIYVALPPFHLSSRSF
jgi:hypothetical protein